MVYNMFCSQFDMSLTPTPWTNNYLNFWVDRKIVIIFIWMGINDHKKSIEEKMTDQPKYFKKSSFI